MNKNSKTILWLVLGSLVGAFMLIWAFRHVAVTDVIDTLREQTHWLPLFFALLFYTFFFVIKACRWASILVTDKEIPFIQLLSLILIGYAGSIILPMQMGEAIRSVFLKKHYNITVTSSLTGIGIEKLFDVGVIAFLMLIATLHTTFFSSNLKQVLPIVVLVFLGAISMLIMLYRHHQTIFTKLRESLLNSNVPNWRLKLTQTVGEMVTSIIKLKGRTLIITALSIAMWISMATAIYLVIYSLGLDVIWTIAILVLFYSTLGLLLPTAPGFIGTIQAVFALVLLPLGWGAEIVLAAAVLYNIMITLFPILLAVFAVFYLKTTRKASH